MLKKSIILRRLTSEEWEKVRNKKIKAVSMDNSNNNFYFHDRFKIENLSELDEETIKILKKEKLTDDGECIKINGFFSRVFLLSLAEDNFSVNQKYMHLEVNSFNVDVVKKDFMDLLTPLINYRFKDELNKYLEKNKIKIDGISLYIYAMTNPIFKQIGFNDQVDNFKNSIQEKLRSDENYYKNIREYCLKEISILQILERKKYIDRFIQLGILNEKDKVDLEYYIDFPIHKIKELFETGVINREELITIVAQIFYFDRNPNELNPKENKKKNKYSNRVVNAMNLLRPLEILDMYLNSGLTDEEFSKTKIKKEDILATCKVGILCYLLRKNDNVPERLKITSKDLINLYGKTIGEDGTLINEESKNEEEAIWKDGNTFGGSTMDELIRCNLIKPEDVIDIYEINKALVHTDFNEEMLYDNYEIIAYYTPRVLLNMTLQDKLTQDFVQKYREMLDFENNKEVFRKKSLILVDGIRNIVEDNARENSETDNINNPEEDIQKFVLYFFNFGLCDLETAKKNISMEFIQYLFMNDELSIEDVFSLYKKGLIGDEVIAEFYNDEELLDLYESGTINRDCLKALRNKNLIIDYFSDGKGQIEDFIDLYLKSDIISINDLNYVCELSDVESSKISNLIDENVPYEKIKELFSNLLIDYSTIQILHSQEIITDDQFEEIKNALSTREFFKEIKNGKKFKVVTLREGNTVHHDKRPKTSREKEEEDFSDEMELISKILGKDVEEEVENDEIAMIESYNLNDRPTSLNNYRIFGNESLDGIVILQKAKKENAVFVMSALQLMYFLKENSTGEIKDRMRDKAYLKTIVGVECIEHTKHFARNLIESTSRVSPKINQQLKESNGKYKTDVEKMIDGMREKYLEEMSK